MTLESNSNLIPRDNSFYIQLFVIKLHQVAIFLSKIDLLLELVAFRLKFKCDLLNTHLLSSSLLSIIDMQLTCFCNSRVQTIGATS